MEGGFVEEDQGVRAPKAAQIPKREILMAVSRRRAVPFRSFFKNLLFLSHHRLPQSCSPDHLRSFSSCCLSLVIPSFLYTFLFPMFCLTVNFRSPQGFQPVRISADRGTVLRFLVYFSEVCEVFLFD